MPGTHGNGRLVPVAHGCLVAVDHWRWKSTNVPAACFLTHMHADHVAGLSDGWRGPLIYCSQATHQLLQQKWPEVAAEPLELERTHSISLPQPGGTSVELSVTLLDADHCPGAVMFLFETPYQRILYTGDFRWEVSNLSARLDNLLLEPESIDVLYMDNTYCEPRCAFPCRADAGRQVLDIVAQHPGHDIVIGVDSLGKEDLLAAVAHACGTPISVPQERLLAVELAGLPTALFTTSTARVQRLRLLPRWMATMQMVARLNRGRPTVAIIASGFGVGAGSGTKKASDAPGRLGAAVPAPADAAAQPVQLHDWLWSSESRTEDLAAYHAVLCQSRVPPDADDRHIPPSAEEVQHARSLLFTVPYSLHSSYAELHALVKRLRPGAVEPIVQGNASKDPRLHFSSLLRRGKRPKPLHCLPEADCSSRKRSHPKAWQASCNEVFRPQGSVSVHSAGVFT